MQARRTAAGRVLYYVRPDFDSALSADTLPIVEEAVVELQRRSLTRSCELEQQARALGRAVRVAWA